MNYRGSFAFTLAWLILTGLPGLGQVSAQHRGCDRNAKTQMEMDACAKNEVALRKKQMDQVYGKLLSRAASQPGAVAKIRASEKAWIAYVDSYITAKYPASDKRWYGTLYPMEVDLTRSGLIQQHVADLAGLLWQYSPK